MILTHDSDYLALHHSGSEHSGILYCHQRRRSPGELVRLLTEIWNQAEASELVNQIKYL